MKYVSLFAGIEAASQAWHVLGWQPLAFADIDRFPSAVLAHHYPDVPNVGNVEEVDWSEYKGKADLVVGGSPCQSFSVAGKRLGMDDPRGNLALEYLRAVKEIQPTWFVFENVPGLLSSEGGSDFGKFLGEVAGIGYGFAWRVLDSQFFGVPQRRRRLFVVGHIGGDWRSAAAVLFESESLQWHTEESTEEGQSLASFFGSGFAGESEALPGGGGVSESSQENWDGTQKTGTLTTRSLDQSMPDKSNFMGIVERDLHEPDNIFESSKSRKDLSPPLDARDQGSTGKPVLTERVIPIHDKATRYKGGGDTRNNDGAGNGLGIGKDGDPMPTLDTASNHAVAQAVDVWNQTIDGEKAATLTEASGGTNTSGPKVMTTYRKSRRAQSTEDNETWVEDEVSNTLNTFDIGDARTTQIIQEPIAFEQNQRSEIRELGTKSTSLKAQPGTNQQTFIAHGEQTPLHGEEVSPTLDASYGKGPGERAGIERQVIGEVIGFSHTQGLDAQPSTEHFPTLRAEGQGHAIGFDWKNTGQTNFSESNTGAPLTAEGGLAVGIDQQVYENHPSDGRINEVDTSPTITAKAGTGGGNLPLVKEQEVAPTLTARDMYDGQASHTVQQQHMAVRRLTPLECERLQGFPDNYTKIPYRGKSAEKCPDGPRYKALGNSMAVPVMRWIGEGIQQVDEILQTLEERPEPQEVIQKSIFDF
jgi:DNA (cytosine-5)-methyltransferase 1